MRTKLLSLIALLSMLCPLVACRAEATPTPALRPTGAMPAVKATPTIAAPTPTDVPTLAFVVTFEDAPCPMELPEGVVEGLDIACGYVTVPEVHALPQGNTIQLGVAVIPSTSERAAPDPFMGRFLG